MLGTGRPTVLHAPKATRASSYKSTSPPASPPKAAAPKKELRPVPGYAGHLMNMHDVGVGQTFGEGSKQTIGATAAALSASAADLPADSLGYFLTSMDTIFLAGAGGSAGDLCIASTAIGRYAGDVLDSGAAGAVSFSPDLTAIPGPTGTVAAMAGETRFFQYWTRDLSGGNSTSNFSTAAGITFQ